MAQDNNIDLGIALNKIHELALEDGDLGYAYWYQIGQLLKRAAGTDGGKVPALTMFSVSTR